MSNKLSTAISIVALLISVIVGFVAVKDSGVFKALGAAGGLLAENYIPYVLYNDGYKSENDIETSADLQTTGTLTVGSSGTAQANQIITTCNPTANTSIAATSTGLIYCTGLTGITSSDYVFASFATSTTGVANSWAILGASASTTAGAVDIKILNLTGAAVVPSASGTFASSTRIHALH